MSDPVDKKKKQAEAEKHKAAGAAAEKELKAKEEKEAPQSRETAEKTKPEAGGQQQNDEKRAGQPQADTAKSEPESTEAIEDDLQNKLNEITDRLQRTMAEFDNFRKRTEKEKAARFEIGERSVVEKMLPVLDNFERGLAGATGEQKADPFVDGMDKVYKQMLTALSELGVKPIEALGQEFDPNFHNAVMHVEDEESGDNIIIEEFQKGYTFKGSVVRYSMVKVAN